MSRIKDRMNFPMFDLLEQLESKPTKVTKTAVPNKKEQSVIISFKGNKELGHWNTESDNVEQIVKQLQTSGYRTEVYSKVEYYRKMRANEFILS